MRGNGNSVVMECLPKHLEGKCLYTPEFFSDKGIDVALIYPNTPPL